MSPQSVGRYELRDQLGRGGMATVFRAYDPRFKREVAIKVLPREYLHDPTFIARFEREAQTIAALEHSAIVPVYDFGEAEGQPYLVMRYMPGGSLADRVAQGPLPLDEAYTILERIGAALDHAHRQGVVHRDVKPANVLFDQAGDAYLSDFGIVKLAESTAQLTGSGIVGTPAYLAPEMMEQGGTTPLIDIYALGVTLYQMLTGEVPYKADTPMGVLMAHLGKPVPDVRPVRPDLPGSIQAVIAGSMAKDPAVRYQSVRAMLRDLRHVTQEWQAALLAEPAYEAPLPEVTQPSYPPHPAPTEPVAPEATPPEYVSPEVAPPDFETVPYYVEGAHVASLEEAAGPAGGRAAPIPTVRPTRRRGPSPIMVIAAAAVVVLGLVGAAILTRGFGLWAVGGLLGPATEAALETITPEPTRPPVTPEPTRPPAVSSPVTHNADWTPYIREIYGVSMALVPAGCFQMGSDETSETQPIHEVCFDEPFWIDVYEVTNGQVGAKAEGCTEYSAEHNEPRLCITWDESLAHCEARGARLPTEAEWEYAARGPDGLTFPWGNSFDCTYGNFDDQTTDGSDVAGVVEGGAGCDGYAVAAPVGSFPQDVSWVGTLDMSGNVAEWVTDWYGDYLGERQVNPQGPASGDFRSIRGGSWFTASVRTLHASYRFGFIQDGRSQSTGLRCALSYDQTPTGLLPVPVTPQPTPLPPDVSSPITRNADWTPYVQELDGVRMALVPAGCFLMGRDESGSERPAHQVCFEEPFWIDEVEVYQAQFAGWEGEAGRASCFTGRYLPRECVTWEEADAFCAKREARLPTEAEWEYAARGPDGLLYPWGDEWDNTLVVYSPSVGVARTIPLDVGSIPGGASWVGALDMSGNVWEWVADWYSDTYYSTLDSGAVNPQGPATGEYRVERGGSWNTAMADVLTATMRARLLPSTQNSNLGFRCARDYED